MRSNIKRYLASHSIDLSHAADYATNIVKEIVHLYN